MWKPSIVLFLAAWTAVGFTGTSPWAEGAEPVAINQPIRPMIQRLEETVGLKMPGETNALVNLYVRGLSNGQFAFEGWDTELAKDLSLRDLIRRKLADVFARRTLERIGGGDLEAAVLEKCNFVLVHVVWIRRQHE